MKNFAILSGSDPNSKKFAKKIAKILKTSVTYVKMTDFSDGEFKPKITKSVRGKIVFIVQSTNIPLRNLFEILLLGDACMRASALSIIAVIPYYGFARQDRKDEARVPITAKVIANLLQATFFNRVICMDLHSDQIQGFFNIPVDHLYASSVFVKYIKKLKLKNLIMASADAGGAKRAGSYAKFLNTDFVICHKQRSGPNKVEKIIIIGDVKGKDVVFIDDLADTTNTIIKATEEAYAQGANSVRALCSHPVLSGGAYSKIEKSQLVEFIVTTTLPLKENIKKINVLSVEEEFAHAISCVVNNRSISSRYKVS